MFCVVKCKCLFWTLRCTFWRWLSIFLPVLFLFLEVAKYFLPVLLKTHSVVLQIFTIVAIRNLQRCFPVVGYILMQTANGECDPVIWRQESAVVVYFVSPVQNFQCPQIFISPRTNFHIPSLMHMAFILLIDVRRQKSNKYYKSRVAQGGHINEPAKNETRLVIH
jgi:hypothetical protein